MWPVSTESGLNYRIRLIEQSLELRRATCSQHFSSVKESLKNKLSSPGMLILAAGGGFLVGRILFAKEKNNSAPISSTFSAILSAFTLTTSVVEFISFITYTAADLTRPKDPERQPPGA